MIDDVMTAISGWYHYPNYQSSPCIVNLWGLTGTGKSALVRELISQLKIEHKMLHFDMSDGPVLSVEIDNAKLHTNAPVIVVDEVQHARTIDVRGYDVRYINGDLWQLLDTGVFSFNTDRTEAHNLIHYVHHLESLLPHIQVEDGLVVREKLMFIEEVDDREWVEANEYGDDKPAPFISKKWDGYLRDQFPRQFVTKHDVRQHLNSLSPEAAIQLCRDAAEQGAKPKTIDISKALVFVCGNLDEAYTMSGDVDAENDPDIFYKQAQMIGIGHIKRALLQRFRYEQIARFGNVHITFPAFGKQQFYDIIDHELDAIRNNVWHDTNTVFHFHESLRQFLFDEGVFPAQGARPLLSTIRYTVHANIGRWMLEKERLGMDPIEIEIGCDDDVLWASYLHHTVEFHVLKIPINSRVKRLRKCEDSEKQAIVAVHEAGHAICLSLLIGTIPSMIFSKKSNASSEGSVLSYFKEPLTTPTILIEKLAVFLAGYAAETLVFGKEHVSSGSSSDIQKATEMALEMARENGFGAHLMKIDDHRFFPLIRDPQHQSDQLAQQWLKEARKLAEDTLRQQEPLLMEMSRHLFKHPVMDRDTIESMVRLHAVDVDLEEVLREKRYYRERLMGQYGERRWLGIPRD